jgi:hypothetical protein
MRPSETNSESFNHHRPVSKCPLWIISRHCGASSPCPLYRRKRISDQLPRHRRSGSFAKLKPKTAKPPASRGLAWPSNYSRRCFQYLVGDVVGQDSFVGIGEVVDAFFHDCHLSARVAQDAGAGGLRGVLGHLRPGYVLPAADYRNFAPCESFPWRRQFTAAAGRGSSRMNPIRFRAFSVW